MTKLVAIGIHTDLDALKLELSVLILHSEGLLFGN